MARSDQIIELIKAGLGGESSKIRAVAESIAAAEREKRHIGVADRIERLLLQGPVSNGIRNSGVRLGDGSAGILSKIPKIPLNKLFLESKVESSVRNFIREQNQADVLRAHGLEPRHRLLLIGPPGNGKTSLAEALAYELALPLFQVRYESVVTSYLGETSQRLKRLFDFVRTHPCILFFDEFDAIGKERGDLHESGEIKRVVTSLLLQLDDLPSYCVLVAATNHPELLDRATWRRFEVRLRIGKPTVKTMTRFIDYHFKQLGPNPGYSAKRLMESIKPESFSEAEVFFMNVKRQVALDYGETSLSSIIRDQISLFNSERFKFTN